MILKTLLPLLFLMGLAHGGKYLFYMPFVSKSMKITFMPVVEELANRGHEVTVVMPYAHGKEIKNVEQIIIENEMEALTNHLSVSMLNGQPIVLPVDKMIGCALKSTEDALKSAPLKAHIAKKTKFDVVVVSAFLANDAGYYLAHYFESDLVLYFTGQTSMSWMDHAMGMSPSPSFVPFTLFSFQHPMSFLQRVGNTVAVFIFEHVMRNWYILGKIDAILDENFPGVERPALLDLERNASLALHFGHPLIMDGNRPYAPNFISIGMMNCRPAQPLPKDLKAFMDNAPHGVIYVSFGSVVKASEMSEERRKVFISVFSQLKQKVLWKWETDSMPDQPPNVMLNKWLPQQDILAHPNMKLFITHGGQSSSQETLCHQKPVVAIPVAGDQPANGREAERVGFGRSILFPEITEDNLLEAIQDVLNNPVYTATAQRHGAALMDQITNPLDRAVWWLEYKLRHPGSDHMKTPVNDLAWFQYYLLDVWAFLGLCLAALFFVAFKCCQFCCCRTSKKSARKPDMQKKRR